MYSKIYPLLKILNSIKRTDRPKITKLCLLFSSNSKIHVLFKTEI